MARSTLPSLLLAAPYVAALCLAAPASIGTALAAGGGNADGAPLRAEEAFVPSVAAADRDSIDIAFDIEPGHYLYRDRISVAPAAPEDGLTLGEPLFAPPILVEDDFFGTSATYRDATLVTVPLEAPETLRDVAIDVTWQGCADIGLCYPPTTTRLDATLPPSPATAPSASRALSNLFGGMASDEPELLSPDVAYVPFVTRATPGAIEVTWRIEPGYYLYRDKLHFTLDSPSGAALGTPELDAGTLRHDEFFGDVAIWRDAPHASLPLVTAAEPGERATLEIAWQGCADVGVCFPPKTTTLEVRFDAATDADDGARAIAATGGGTGIMPGGGTGDGTSDGTSDGTGGGTGGGTGRGTSDGAGAQTTAVTGESLAVAGTGAGDATPPLQSEQGRLAALLGSRGLWLNAATFFGLGLLLAFTPCVLPMIPILSSLIVGRGADMSSGRAFRLSLVYVLVMAGTYAVLGVVVGLSGYNVQPLLQDPLVLSLLAAVFVALSLSMFGLYELQVPLALQQRLARWSNRQRGGEVGGVAVMALLSTLIVGPCVTAPLAGALIYIADSGNAAIGGVALFSLGLGMGAPLLLIGTSAGTLLPRAGAWMERTRQVFGLLLLAMAIYMLSRFLPANVTMALAGALALSSGVLFGATDTLTSASAGRQRFAKGVGLVVSVYGLALLVGALAGGGSYATPLGALAARGGPSGETPAEARGLAFRAVKGPDGLAAAVAEASAAGRPLMLDFYADWCVSCKEMEAFTFTDPAVRAALSDALVVRADVTANDAEDRALLAQFGLFGPPGIVFYGADGREHPGARVVGFVPAERFAEHVERALGGRPT